MANECLTTLPLTIFTQRNIVADYLQRSAILDGNQPFCVFEPPPPLGGLEAMYDDHLRLIGKRVVDFLLMLIELFSLNVTAEAPQTNIGSKLVISLLWLTKKFR